MSVFTTPLTQAAWRSRPSWIIVATQDAAIDPRMPGRQAQKIGAEVRRIETSHAPSC